MRNLINFLIRYRTWLLFVAFLVISIMLLIRGNKYHQSVYLTSANAVTSTITGTLNSVVGYFNLVQTNRDLMTTNAMLQKEVLNLTDRLQTLESLKSDSTGFPGLGHERFNFIPAKVINNSLRHPRNFFTIDKGSADGVASGMGVVDHNGIIGIVNVTGPHTSRVISILNVKQNFSAKIKGTGFDGMINWKGNDPHVVYMENVPRHAKFHPGDTIVTSGYSSTFPPGLMIGTVMNRVHGKEDNYFTLKVKLASDISSLSSVRVLKDEFKNEVDSLVQFDPKE